jgi:glycosyltransferase involved in cell wall biosynthesis
LIKSGPLISVIIPSFNYEAFVGQTIDSVLSQDYPHRELIVVDDGSSDGSWDVIQSYGEAISALRTPNGGPLRACLEAARRARGEYIYILDSDDLLNGSGALAAIADAIAPGVSKVQFPLLPIDENGRAIGRAFPRLNPGDTSRDLRAMVLAGGCYTTPPTSGNVYRRDVWMLGASVDYEIWTDGIAYLAAPFYGEVVSLAEALACRREHGSNVSLTGDAVARVATERALFTARLEHLAQLIGEDLRGQLAAPERCFAYLERLILEQIWRGARAEASLVAAARRAVMREPSGVLRRVLLLTWLAAIALAPKAAGVWLADLKLPRAQRSGIGTFVRKVY